MFSAPDRRSFLAAALGGGSALLAQSAGQRDWTGKTPLRYPDPDVIVVITATASWPPTKAEGRLEGETPFTASVSQLRSLDDFAGGLSFGRRHLF